MKATDPVIAAALARMDVREGKSAPVEWHTSERSHRCSWCRSKTALMIYKVRPHRRPERAYGVGEHQHIFPAQRYSTLSAECIDEDACKARRERAYENRQKRSGNLRWAQSRFESPNIDLPKGSCRWCGEPILYVEDAPYRVKCRERHRGDEYEIGEQNCRREHNRTFAANGRELIERRGDPCCVDCGEAEVWHDPGDGTEGWWLTGQWEADHDVAIADGGPHTPTNILRRCRSCHRHKTIEEARRRRHPSGQLVSRS